MQRFILFILTLLAAQSSLWAIRPGDDVYIPEPETVRRNSIRTIKLYEHNEDPGTEDKSESLQRVYRFDSLGRMVEEVRYDLKFTCRYAYDGNGRLAREERISDSGSIFFYDGTYLYSYDEAGNRVLSRSLEYDGSEGYRIVSSYVGNRITESVMYMGNTASNRPHAELMRDTYLYDTVGRLIEQRSESDFETDSRFAYSYDSAGHCTDTRFYDHRMILQSRIEHVFESDLVVQRRAYVSEDILHYTSIYIRNEEGLIVEETHLESDWKGEGEVIGKRITRFVYERF